MPSLALVGWLSLPRVAKSWGNGAGAKLRPALPGFAYTLPHGNSAKDRRTLETIGGIYCRGNHAERIKDAAGMCPECREAIERTLDRAASCPHGHTGNCQDCRTRCQRGEAQRRIKEIMRYAAPRMTFCHSLMTLDYLRKKLGKR